MVCLGTIVMDRCEIRMGSDNDATGIQDCFFDQTRIYGNGGTDIYSARTNVMSSLLLRQFEVENTGVQTRINQAALHPTFQEATMLFQSLGLQN